ncbi:hypothetical protein [Streptomyces sp. NPDC055085]
MGPEHAAEVLKIYREHFDSPRLPDHRHVALDDSGTVLGWAAAVPASDQCAYAMPCPAGSVSSQSR